MNMPMQLCRQRSAVKSDFLVKMCLSSFPAVRTQNTQYKVFRRENPQNYKYVFDMIFDQYSGRLCLTKVLISDLRFAEVFHTVSNENIFILYSGIIFHQFWRRCTQSTSNGIFKKV